jgi:hypothetical protein
MRRDTLDSVTLANAAVSLWWEGHLDIGDISTGAVMSACKPESISALLVEFTMGDNAPPRRRPNVDDNEDEDEDEDEDGDAEADDEPDPAVVREPDE